MSLKPADIDSDGLPDDWENQYFGNLDQGPQDDYDGDGLTNLEEYDYGTDPKKRDTDGDGYSDKEETDAGKNPNNPNDYPASAPLNCTIKLEKCSSEPYLDPNMPFCWPVYFIGIGASFNIYVGGSTGDIKRLRFLSDESQNDKVDEGFTWTGWYDWNISSGDWNHLSKTMTWSFATGGEKEVWVEIEDSTGQTRICAEDIVVPESLPGYISLDDVEISTIISWLTKDWATDEPWPVFLSVGLRDSNIMANILLIASKTPVTKYKLVKIKTDDVADPRNLKLYGVLPSTPSGCVKNYVQNMLTGWFTNFWQKLGERVLIEIGKEIIGTALGLKIPASAISFSGSLIECSEEGYAEPFEGWKPGEDYLVYLPVDLPEGLDLTVMPKRDICPCLLEASVSTIFTCDCPGQVQGMWKGRIYDWTNEIPVEIEETNNWWAKIFKVLSPVELRVYDPQRRISGLVNGGIWEDIPNSVYDRENNAVGIFFPTDSYLSEIVGTGEGNYGFQAISVQNGKATTFTATDIPTSPNAIHQYAIDWGVVSQGGEGVTVQIDSDGNGVFEQTITTGSEFIGRPVRITGGAYFYPETPTYRASFSMDVTGPISPSGWLKYYYTRTRMNFVSNGITSASVSGDTGEISGTGTVNGVGGYTFGATITNGSPDTFAILIKKPDGSTYYSAGPKSISGRDLVIQ